MVARVSDIQPGRYYRRGRSGQLREVAPDDEVPDATICRRLIDFPLGQPLPPGAAIATCVDCGTTVVFNPQGRHPSIDKLCMQCAGIMPLPLETRGQ